MREQQANYATGQDYGTPVSNMPRSARRYQSARRPTVEQVIEDVETVEVEFVPSRIPARNTASRGNRVIEEGYSQRQPRRARTDEDRYIDERVIPQQSRRTMAVPQQQVQPPQRRGSRRGFLLKLGGMALGLISGGVILGKWAGDTYNDIHQQIEQGQQPATSIYLKCGHNNDSDAHRTQLQVFINQDERCLVFVELPGGDITKAHLFKTPHIQSTGDMKYWHVGITPNQVDAGKYMIALTVRTPDDNIIHQWLLVDSGQGFFRAVNPK